MRKEFPYHDYAACLPVSQITPASSWCSQSPCPQPRWSHSESWVSSPSHSTLSNQIFPEPSPNAALLMASPPVYPNCRHTTWASGVSHLKWPPYFSDIRNRGILIHWGRDKINNITAFIQIMAWRWTGDKPLSEPIMAKLLTPICVALPQWVNCDLIRYTI